MLFKIEKAEKILAKANKMSAREERVQATTQNKFSNLSRYMILQR